jgi:hypothetical protein
MLMKRYILGVLAVSVVVAVAALFAALRGEGSTTPIAGFARDATSSDAFPQTALATKLANSLGVDTAKTRRIAADDNGRALFVAPTSKGQFCLLLVGTTTDTELIYGCGDKGQAFFAHGVNENARLMVHDLGGQPEAPTSVEVAGVVRAQADIASMRFGFGSKQVTVPVTKDGGFLFTTSVPGVSLTSAVALDASDRQVERLSVAGS